jgi:2-polyprenyl-3-methyl-5-hydroxy-6-metoxy-1,4-benzoquinol methylase
VRDDYGESYRELYQRHWWWRSREAFILDVLRSRRPAQGWKRILDVGCGDGLFFGQLARFGEVEGVEPVETLVSKSGPHYSCIHVVPFDADFQPGKLYSLILMLDVLEHLADPVGALRHAMELLEPAGIVLVTVPAFNFLWTNHDVINAHVTRYTRASFRKLARQAGMEIEMGRYFFNWLVPAKLATRLSERVLGLQPEPPSVPAVWINGLFYGLSRLEQRTWGLLPLPLGSSFMAVGRRSGGTTTGHSSSARS